MTRATIIVLMVLLCATVSQAQDPTQEATPEPATIWQPAPGITWQWQLNDEVNTTYDVEMYDVDLFGTPQTTIDALHDEGRIVICYFSAGTHEDWRDDADAFPDAVIGKPLPEWKGERWLDVRQIRVLQPIMEARMDVAVKKHCDGVEPDNVDAYSTDTGFTLTAEDQLVYNRWLAAAAHERGLSVGLKNDLGQIEDLVDDFDWALNEECFQYEECEQLLPFITAGKAVIGVEYVESGLDRAEYCPAANAYGFSWLTKSLDLGDLPPNSCLDFEANPQPK